MSSSLGFPLVQIKRPGVATRDQLPVLLHQNSNQLICEIVHIFCRYDEYVIRLKRIYNFWCSMLVLHHVLHVLFTLRGVFMRFPELTYWQDAIVPVPCFLLFLCFRKATQEIFSELDKIKAKTPIFPGRRTRTEREQEGGQRAGSPGGGAPPSWPRQGWWSPLVALWRHLSAYKEPSNKKP
jgi:hypothetical protein